MKKVHEKFTGRNGTFAHFGDSITVTMAFWTPLAYDPKGMSEKMAQALKLVKSYMKPECWREWKGAEYGNTGMMTIRWAHENVNEWLKKLNPEVVLIMFGSNDVGQMEVQEYEQKTREVVERCLKNGSVVILTTMPPRSGMLGKSRAFAEASDRLFRRDLEAATRRLGRLAAEVQGHPRRRVPGADAHLPRRSSSVKPERLSALLGRLAAKQRLCLTELSDTPRLCRCYPERLAVASLGFTSRAFARPAMPGRER
jgi:hypothetical protein